MHSLIISSLQQEPLFTAEEVINEIESMMEVSVRINGLKLSTISMEGMAEVVC